MKDHSWLTFRENGRKKAYPPASSRMRGKDACSGAFISVAKLEQAVIEEINRLSAQYLDKQELEERIEFQNHLTVQKKRLRLKQERMNTLSGQTVIWRKPLPAALR